MIVYQGIKSRNKLFFLCLTNDKKKQIEIPIDEATGRRIGIYLEHFSDGIITPVERGNDELVEEQGEIVHENV